MSDCISLWAVHSSTRLILAFQVLKTLYKKVKISKMSNTMSLILHSRNVSFPFVSFESTCNLCDLSSDLSGAMDSKIWAQCFMVQPASIYSNKKHLCFVSTSTELCSLAYVPHTWWLHCFNTSIKSSMKQCSITPLKWMHVREVGSAF